MKYSKKNEQLLRLIKADKLEAVLRFITTRYGVVITFCDVETFEENYACEFSDGELFNAASDFSATEIYHADDVVGYAVCRGTRRDAEDLQDASALICSVIDIVLPRKAIQKKLQKVVKPQKADEELREADKYIEKAIDYIKEHFRENISLSDVATNVFVSKFYLSHLFKKKVGISFSENLQKLRMSEAATLLRTTDLSVQEITFRVGFTEPNYFAKSFKKYFGVTPTQYKEL